MAVDPISDDVYVAHADHIAEYDSQQRFVGSFGEGHLISTGAVAVDGATQQIFATDSTSGALQEYVPRNQPSEPAIDGLKISGISTTTATAEIQVDPDGSETVATIEYCDEAVCKPLTLETIAAGYGDTARTAPLPDLTPGSQYTVRAVATNALGSASRREAAFTTRPVAVADNRAWGSVSPSDARGANYESNPKEGGIIEASEDGSALTYLATAPTEEAVQGNRSPPSVRFSQSGKSMRRAASRNGLRRT